MNDYLDYADVKIKIDKGELVAVGKAIRKPTSLELYNLEADAKKQTIETGLKHYIVHNRQTDTLQVYYLK